MSKVTRDAEKYLQGPPTLTTSMSRVNRAASACGYSPVVVKNVWPREGECGVDIRILVGDVSVHPYNCRFVGCVYGSMCLLCRFGQRRPPEGDGDRSTRQTPAGCFLRTGIYPGVTYEWVHGCTRGIAQCAKTRYVCSLLQSTYVTDCHCCEPSLHIEKIAPKHRLMARKPKSVIGFKRE